MFGVFEISPNSGTDQQQNDYAEFQNLDNGIPEFELTPAAAGARYERPATEGSEVAALVKSISTEYLHPKAPPY